jgi:hypothetical protein
LFAACFEDRTARIRFIALVTVVAGVVFLLVELPVFWEFTQFLDAVRFELSHAAHGHDVRLPISLTHGIFHLRESLLPGLGLPLVALGLVGLTTPLWAAPPRRQALLVIAAFAMLWYAVHELSPLKPFPGFARYALPLAPLLIILGASFVGELTDRYLRYGSKAISAAIIVLAAIPALYLSVRINGPSADDPRAAVPPLIAGMHPTPYFDRYTKFMHLAGSTLPTNLLVTSSFRYERFIRFGSNRYQHGVVRYAADYYNALFQLPYLEVTNRRPSFAFFNPVTRIVALDGDVDRLKSIAAAILRGSEGLTVDLVHGGEGTGKLTCPYQGRPLPSPLDPL